MLWYVSQQSKPHQEGRPEETEVIKPESEEAQQAQSAEPSKIEQLLNDVQPESFAAERDFPNFLAGAWSQKVNNGFKAENEQQHMSLGEPVFIYSIDEEIAGQIYRKEDLVTAVKPVGEWIYSVQVEQVYRTLFGVRLRNNKWSGTYPGTMDHKQLIDITSSNKMEDLIHYEAERLVGILPEE